MTALKTLSLSFAAALLLGACNASAPAQPDVSAADFSAALDAQTDATKARYAARNPGQTLAFFGLRPGMKVAESLPGGSWDRSWYTRILSPYLGKDGHLSGVDYNPDMWPLFGFFGPEFIEEKKTWPQTWTDSVTAGAGETAPAVDAFTFADLPENTAGTYDAVLFIRALHNLSRFEDKGGYLTESITAAHSMLKPGGIVGVVQHRAPQNATDEWAKGQNGYVKQSDVIAAFEAAGFELVATSEINANPKDEPVEGDIVWRLPPSLSGSEEGSELREIMMAIGESDRMTLKFVKK